MKNGPLDMRMDPNEWLTAAEVVNRYSRDDLERIFREYGEEHHAGRIADGIVERRKTKPFSRTTELAAAIKEYMPGHGRGEDQHPAKRCFQAIRIEVNHELDARRQNSQRSVQNGREPVHMPERFPCMCMRQEVTRHGNNQKADRTDTGRDRHQPESEKFKTQGFREKRQRTVQLINTKGKYKR